jgi:hypothetical protein
MTASPSSAAHVNKLLGKRVLGGGGGGRITRLFVVAGDAQLAGTLYGTVSGPGGQCGAETRPVS